MALFAKQVRMPFRITVILWVGICSIALSFWCLLVSASSQFQRCPAGPIKKGIVAVDMSVIIVMMAASKDDKENALRAVVLPAKKIGFWSRGESD